MPPRKRAAKEAVDAAAVSNSKQEADQQEEKKSKPKKAKAQQPAAESEVASSESDVHITGSKACQAFAKHAARLKDAICAKRPTTSVTIVHEKKLSSNPDKGSFIVKANGKTLVELVAMARPFNKMKELDLEQVAVDVVAALK